MKPDGIAFMEWLHQRREAKERERLEQGISEAEWLRRMHEEADRILAGLRHPEQVPAARDRGR
jgi:hypothetical protein